ncbi:MAG: aminotransferase class III-fold pyridoxal phosphate-dependent enzyme, partial [Chloroflexi bacterium]|nr:aminotransferase class III-fold pyridoxal phosphate-dependent enzyme [Chloroflexota bacterium]
MAGGVSSNFRLGTEPVPLFIERAQGSHLVDADGNSYVDYVLGMGPDILGHAPPEVVEAVTAALAEGQLFAGQHRREVELARLLTDLIPSAELVRFGSSGSEMVHAALRLARAATGRAKVVKFEGHYHGWFDTILVSTSPPLAEIGSREEPIPYRQTAGQPASTVADVVVLPWNELSLVEAYLGKHAGDTAAVIMEPILCNTSVIAPHPGYLEGVRQLCSRHGVVLIFDEVITGFRAGPGGAERRLGVVPDLSVLAKALGSGFPIAALAGRAWLMERFGDGTVLHGGTYNSNVACIAAALATVTRLAAEDGAAGVALEKRGSQLMDGLRALAAETDTPLRVQGFGWTFNTTFGGPTCIDDYRSYQASDLGRQRAFLRALQDHGVRVTSRGTWFLSTAHTDADISQTLEAAR